MAKRKIIEHPDDWNMHEGPFAKACSQLGYRLITLADSHRRKVPDHGEELLLDQISSYVRLIGG